MPLDAFAALEKVRRRGRRGFPSIGSLPARPYGPAMERRFLSELNERLFTHFAGGAWRAPHSERHLPVPKATGGALGAIVCAGPADVARARGVLRLGPAPRRVDGVALWAALMAEAPVVGAMRALEGFAGDALTAPEPPEPVELPRRGPLVLLSAAATPVDRIAGVLIAGAAAGLIWKPAPAAAASAHLIMRVLGPLAEGRLALLQGDHATGALLAAQGSLIWAGSGRLPEGLPRPALDLAAAPGAAISTRGRAP